MKYDFYLFRGVQGSGKSTAAARLTDTVIEADQYFLQDGVYKFNPVFLNEAHHTCFSRFARSIRGDGSVSVANVNRSRKDMMRYVEAAECAGISICIVETINDFGSIHDVPRDKIEAVRSKFYQPRITDDESCIPYYHSKDGIETLVGYTNLDR